MTTAMSRSRSASGDGFSPPSSSREMKRSISFEFRISDFDFRNGGSPPPRRPSASPHSRPLFDPLLESPLRRFERLFARGGGIISSALSVTIRLWTSLWPFSRHDHRRFRGSARPPSRRAAGLACLSSDRGTGSSDPRGSAERRERNRRGLGSAAVRREESKDDQDGYQTRHAGSLERTPGRMQRLELTRERVVSRDPQASPGTVRLDSPALPLIVARLHSQPECPLSTPEPPWSGLS